MWAELFNTDELDSSQRAFLMLLGEGGVGKTAFQVCLLDKPFKHTGSTVGVDTSTMDVTDARNCREIRISGFEQVISCTL